MACQSTTGTYLRISWRHSNDAMNDADAARRPASHFQADADVHRRSPQESGFPGIVSAVRKVQYADDSYNSVRMNTSRKRHDEPLRVGVVHEVRFYGHTD
jgi:hypothetical protein